MKFNKILYLRDQEGKYIAWISQIKLAAIGLVLIACAIGTLYSVLNAPKTMALTQEDILAQAIQTARWEATGTQEYVDGNVLWAEFNGDPNEPSKDTGSDPQVLTDWMNWREAQVQSELDELRIRAGEPTAILNRVCRENGQLDSDCPRTLYAMAMQESYFGKAMVGDNGRSIGWFHIMDYNNVPDTCALDLECSANWSLKRLIRFGYPAYRSIAIMAHNGTPNTKTTKNYLAAVNSKMALWPN